MNTLSTTQEQQNAVDKNNDEIKRRKGSMASNKWLEGLPADQVIIDPVHSEAEFTNLKIN